MVYGSTAQLREVVEYIEQSNRVCYIGLVEFLSVVCKTIIAKTFVMLGNNRSSAANPSTDH